MEEEEEERKQHKFEEKETLSRDVYAFGIGMMQFIKRKAPTLDTPFKGVSDFKDLVLKGERPSLPRDEIDCPKSLAELLRECWHDNPKKRPTFQDILHRFEEHILIDCATVDPNARKFWKENFFNPGDSKQELRTNIPWKEFAVKFLKNFDSKSYDEKDVEMKVFNEICSTKGSVTLENFGRTVGFFFPLVPLLQLKNTDVGWLRKVSFTVRQPWFFGDIDSDEAFKRLRIKNKEGDFLLRFSKSGSNWTLSYIGQKNSVYHTRILHPPSSFTFTVEGKNASTFDSLQELVSYLKATELISNVCEGHPFAAFFNEQSQEARNEGYAELDFSN